MPRLIKTIFEFYPVLLPVTLCCIVFNAIVTSIPAIFMQNIVSVVEQNWNVGDWSQVSGQIAAYIGILAAAYIASLIAAFAYNRMMAIITQGTLSKLRIKMFDGMQDLPIKYFDSHNHGDIMSYYTNDIDMLRQMISQSLPQLVISVVTVITVLGIMLYYCLWLLLVVVAGVTIMLLTTKWVGGGSIKYFRRQQAAMGKVEGFAEEIMNGQKVVKVFCHEPQTEADFNRLNKEWFRVSERANQYANTLMPILMNVGNVLYVIVALCGGLLIAAKAPNISLSGLPIGISIVIPFLNMTKQFAGSVSQVSNQLNAVVTGLAGAERIFDLIDQTPETDDGYVTLVNVREEDGQLVECHERTGLWAWKHPHRADGTITYTRLRGEVRFFDVDFCYTEDNIVLHNITL